MDDLDYEPEWPADTVLCPECNHTVQTGIDGFCGEPNCPVVRPVDPLGEALRCLHRAGKERLGYQRNRWLDEAATALRRAGLPEYAARLDAAQEPFGGGWADAERVERELSERRGGR